MLVMIVDDRLNIQDLGYKILSKAIMHTSKVMSVRNIQVLTINFDAKDHSQLID